MNRLAARGCRNLRVQFAKVLVILQIVNDSDPADQPPLVRGRSYSLALRRALRLKK